MFKIVGLASGIFAVVIAMLLLGTTSSVIAPSISSTLINSGIALAFILAPAYVVPKLL